MKLRRTALCLLLSIAMLTTFMPGIAFASAETDAGQTQTYEDENIGADDAETVSDQMDEGVVISTDIPLNTYKGGDLADSDELLLDYFDNAVTREAGSIKSSKMLKARRATRGSQLGETDKAIYDALAVMISEVASGQRPSADFTIPVRDIWGDKVSYTADELGVSAIIVYNEESQEYEISEEALDAFYAQYVYDGYAILNALLADMPYEMYWYDKTIGCSYGLGGVGATGGTTETIMFDETEGPAVLQWTMYVSSDYSQGNMTGSFDVDTARTSSAANAAVNAAEIIDRYADLNDLDKLSYYKNDICDLTDYNHAAAENADTPYGDPWQMINVFDGDETTTVVCEGYSKAFQYLCDKSSFISDAVECYSVTGEMYGEEATGAGNHMWNVVHMDDGRNYIADITNSDTGTAGDPDWLFLRGYYDVTDSGVYIYKCDDNGDSTLSYDYDDETLSLYGDDVLKMSRVDYGEEDPDGPGPDEPDPGADENIESISFTLADAKDAITLTEELEGTPQEFATYDQDGNWTGTRQGFYYYFPGYEIGDKVTISYKDGTEKTYVYDYRIFGIEDTYSVTGFYNVEDESDMLDSEEYYSSSNQYEVGGWILQEDGTAQDYYFTFTYKGAEARIPVTIRKNPVESIEYTLADGSKEFSYTEGKNCYQTSDFEYDDETGEEIEHVYNRYDYRNIREGDILKVNYTDGTSKTYAAGYPEGNEDGSGFFFINTEDKTDFFDRNEVSESDNQSYQNVWEVNKPDGAEYSIMYSYMGQTAKINVIIEENPIKDIRIAKADGSDTFELMEGIDGSMAWGYIYDEEENEQEVEYFRYSITFEEGDQLIIEGRDGSEKVYKYTQDFRNPDGYYENAFVCGEEYIDVEDVDYFSDPQQSANDPWTVGNTYKCTASCNDDYGKSTFNIRIVPNPVRSIEFVRGGDYAGKPYEYIVGTHGGIWGDDVYDPETGDEQYVEFYGYAEPSVRRGDKLIINYNDELRQYVYKSVPEIHDGYTYYTDCFVNINNDNDRIHHSEIEWTSNQSGENQWTETGKEYNYQLKYFNRTSDVPVRLIESPVASMRFEAGSGDKVTLCENYDGNWNSYFDDDDAEHEYFSYKYYFEPGDKIYVTDSNGRETEYVLLEDGNFSERFVDPDDPKDFIEVGEIEYKEISAEEMSKWKAGSEYSFTYSYLGEEFDVPVVIEASPVASIDFTLAGGKDKVTFNEDIDYYGLEYSAGDTVVVTYKDGSSKKFVYTYGDNDDSFLAEDGESIWLSSDSKPSDSDEWKPGAEGLGFEVTYKGASDFVPAEVTEDPVESIEFTQGEHDPYVFREGVDGYTYYDEYWYADPSFQTGDIITVNYRSGSSVDYRFNDECWRMVNGDEQLDARYISFDSDQSEDNTWKVGNHEYYIWYGNHKAENPMPVVVEASDDMVVSISYEPVTDWVLVEDLSGSWNRDYDMGYNAVYWTYDPVGFRPGDKLTLTTRKGDSIVYTYAYASNGNGYFTYYDEQEGYTRRLSIYIYDSGFYDDQDYDNLWKPGDTGHKFVFRYSDLECDVPVTIVTQEQANAMLTYVPEKSATCETAGVSAHWKSSDGKLYLDKDGKTQTTQTDLVIPAKGHKIYKDSGAAPSCYYDGIGEHWFCYYCGKVFSDAEGRTEITFDSVSIPATGHEWSEPVYTWAEDHSYVVAKSNCKHDPSHEASEKRKAERIADSEASCTEPVKVTYKSGSFRNPLFKEQTVEVPDGEPLGHDEEVIPGKAATCTETGLTDGKRCRRCGEITAQQEVIPALGHEWSEWNVTKEATETEEGFEERVCSRCGEKETRTIPALQHEHKLVKTAAEAAACEEDGNIEYWTCSECGLIFRDAEGKNQISEEETVVKAIGHEWGEITYSWAEDNSTVHAVQYCSHDRTHQKTETVHAAADVHDETCTEKGYTIYTATFDASSPFETQTKRVEGKDALGHSWGKASYKWADDLSTVTAARVCSRDPQHTETETVKTEKNLADLATCTDKPVYQYVAKFSNPAFEEQYQSQAEGSPLGHDWGDTEYTWSDDNSKVHAVQYCRHDKAHKRSADADAVSEEQPATCTEAGYTLYTAAFETPFETQTKKVDIAAKGHNLVRTDAKAATLEAEGNIEYWTCSVCGDIFSDNAGRNKITKADIVIPKLIDISEAEVTGIVSKTYTGKALTQNPAVTYDGKDLTADTDYSVTYANNKNAGTAKITITGLGKFCGSAEKTFTISKAKGTMTVKGKTATVKYSSVKKKNQTLTVSKVLTISKKKGKVTYKKSSGNSKITISKTTGKVTVKKGLKKGTYSIKVKVTDAGTSNYKSLSKTVTFKVKVK